MKECVCGVVCGGLVASSLWLASSDLCWGNRFHFDSLSWTVTRQNAPPASGSVTAHLLRAQAAEREEKIRLVNSSSKSLLDETNPIQEIAQGDANAEIACFGTAFGASCLSEDGGWSLYTPENSGLSAPGMVDIAVCADESVVFAHSDGIDILRRGQWVAVGTATWDTTAEVTTVACLADGSIWVGYEDGISQFDGTNWNTHDRSVLQNPAAGPVDMVGDANGHLWVLTPQSIARFDGNEWTTFVPGDGLPDEETGLSGIDIGENGRPRARDGLYNRALRFNGERWVVRDVEQPTQITGFSIDARDSEWVTSELEGAWVYSRGGAVVHDRDSGSLSSNQVLAIATDDAGRTWLGTSWGVNVFDGRDWTVYHMDTADLPDNRIVVIDVAGDGPELPALLTKPPGTLIGNLVRSGEPVAETIVEVCVDSLEMAVRGPTPCINQSIFYAAITDAAGRFTFAELPTGRYALAFLDGGEWTQVEKGLLDSPISRVLVSPGETTEIGLLDVTP